MQAPVSTEAKSATAELRLEGVQFTGKAGIFSDLRRVGERLLDPDAEPRSWRRIQLPRGGATGVAQAGRHGEPSGNAVGSASWEEGRKARQREKCEGGGT